MALQIRRGTDAERLLIIPLQGELIFTTDTKKLYVGDGTTQGGVASDTNTGGVGGSTTLAGLSDVSLTTLSSGQVLKWNGSQWVNDSDLNSGIGSVSLNDVLDVVITAPASSQVLSYNGTNWVNGPITLSLDNLSNVSAIAPSPGDLLIYNGVEWASAPLSLSLDSLNDATVTSPLIGDVVKWSGTAWVNGTLTIDEVTSVLTPIAGDILQYNGTDWINEPFPTEINSVITDGLNPVLDPNLSTLDISSISTNQIISKSVTLSLGDELNETDVRIYGSPGLSLYGAGFQPSNIEFNVSSGTIAAPGVMPTGTATTISSSGWNGTEYRTFTSIASRVAAEYTGIPGDPTPGNFLFITTNATGVQNQTIMSSTGTLSSSQFRANGFASAAARDLQITTPSPGVFTYLQDRSRITMYVADTGLATGGAATSTPGWVFINGSLT